MIIAERKSIGELKEMIKALQRILIVGCGTCTTVCMAGGEKEVEILASALRITCKLDGRELSTEEITIKRQCEWEFVDQLAEKVSEFDGILSMGCGVGVQALSERFPNCKVFPAVNTKCIGMPEELGVWSERCLACGDCALHRFGGICPIARCSKGLLNGPCGGSRNGKCEVGEILCGWQLIYDRLRDLGELNRLEEILPPKNWSKAHYGGPRKVIREDLRLQNKKEKVI